MKVQNISTKTNLDSLCYNTFQFGFHPLFYFQRARGDIFVIEDNDVTLVCSNRLDVKKFIIIRPIGNIASIVNTLKKLSSHFIDEYGFFYIKYANEELKTILNNEFNISFDFFWSGNSLFDDETYPQIQYDLMEVNDIAISKRSKHRWIRQCIKSFKSSIYHKKLVYSQIEFEKLLNFSKINVPKSIKNKIQSLNEFYGFVNSTFDGITKYNKNIDFHIFLNNLDEIVGILISAHKEAHVDVYFLSHKNLPKLSTFILVTVMKYYLDKGASYFCVGGSETESLHLFKEQLLLECRKTSTFLIKIMS